MSLLKDYSITSDAKGNYIMDFNTNSNASVSYKQESDGTHVITVTEDPRGTTSFNNNFGNASLNFKFSFNQQGGLNRGSGKPSGSIIGG